MIIKTAHDITFYVTLCYTFKLMALTANLKREGKVVGVETLFRRRTATSLVEETF